MAIIGWCNGVKHCKHKNTIHYYAYCLWKPFGFNHKYDYDDDRVPQSQINNKMLLFYNFISMNFENGTNDSQLTYRSTANNNNNNNLSDGKGLFGCVGPLLNRYYYSFEIHSSISNTEPSIYSIYSSYLLTWKMMNTIWWKWEVRSFCFPIWIRNWKFAFLILIILCLCFVDTETRQTFNMLFYCDVECWGKQILLWYVSNIGCIDQHSTWISLRHLVT